jgi:hypothetical protein
LADLAAPVKALTRGVEATLLDSTASGMAGIGRRVPDDREPTFLFLFVGLLALLIGIPLADTLLGRSAVLVPTGYSVLLLSGVWTLARSPLGFRLGLALVAASIAVTALSYLHPASALPLLALAIAFSFCLLTAILCMRHVFGRHVVTANHLLGAACVYLLLGVLWGLAYAGLYSIDAGWFRAASAGTLTLDDFMYFSFVTLTTTGYGDILPEGRLVRALASIQGVVGQLYVAILVATLVSQYVLPPRKGQP